MEDFESLLQLYKLTEEESNKQVTDSHLDDISRSNCSRWRSLPPQLEIENIVVEDIDREHKGEEEKRKDFFYAWKQKKGSLATYKKLICALLKIECKDDAEGVFKLLQQSLSTQQPHSSVPLRSKSTQTESESTGNIKSP